MTGLVLWCLLLAGVGKAEPPPRATRVSPAQAAVAEGIALLHQNKMAQARERFEAALALDPASADAHFMLGWLHQQEKDLGAAEAEEFNRLQSLAYERAAPFDRALLPTAADLRGELERLPEEPAP